MAGRPQPLRSGLSGTSPIAPPTPAPPAPAPAEAASPEARTNPTTTTPAQPAAAPAPARTPSQPAAATETSSASPKTPARDKSRPGRSARTSTPKTGGAVTSRKWDEYEAKTARLRPDQRLQLTTIARQLTLAKKGAGEKITDNTLIRVAVDILIAESPRLLEDNQDGPLTTEQEIRVKLGLTR